MKKQSPPVHQAILFDVTKIETTEGEKWIVTGPDATGCIRYSMEYSSHDVPTKDWSLLVATQHETTRYYFYHKNYDVQLCAKILHITYTKKERA